MDCDQRIDDIDFIANRRTITQMTTNIIPQ